MKLSRALAEITDGRILKSAIHLLMQGLFGRSGMSMSEWYIDGMSMAAMYIQYYPVLLWILSHRARGALIHGKFPVWGTCALGTFTSHHQQYLIDDRKSISKHSSQSPTVWVIRPAFASKLNCLFPLLPSCSFAQGAFSSPGAFWILGHSGRHS